MTHRPSLTVALAVSLALITLASPAGARPPSFPQTAQTGLNGPLPDNSRRDIRDFEDGQRDSRRVEAQLAADPERAARAEQIAVLVRDGKCAEARRLANEAGDRSMALRVRQTCRAR